MALYQHFLGLTINERSLFVEVAFVKKVSRKSVVHYLAQPTELSSFISCAISASTTGQDFASPLLSKFVSDSSQTSGLDLAVFWIPLLQSFPGKVIHEFGIPAATPLFQNLFISIIYAEQRLGFTELL